MRRVQPHTARRSFLIATAACLVTAVGLIFLTSVRQAHAQGKANLLGGAHGVVKNAEGYPLEGIMVQLISQKNSIRTTVYTDELGKYEFPKLESGDYTLRIARPLEYRRYRKDGVPINGAPALDEITLDRVTNSEYLPPTPDLLPQLTEAEWVANLPGTGQEKRLSSTRAAAVAMVSKISFAPGLASKTGTRSCAA